MAEPLLPATVRLVSATEALAALALADVAEPELELESEPGSEPEAAEA